MNFLEKKECRTIYELSNSETYFQQYAAVRKHFGSITFSPCGKFIAYIIKTSGQLNIWTQPIEGGWPNQITYFENERVREVLWTKYGYIIGLLDNNGNENCQIFSINATGGEINYLTNNKKAMFSITNRSLSPDGRYLAYVTNEINRSKLDVAILDLETGKNKITYSNGGFNTIAQWSSDSNTLCILQTLTNSQKKAIFINIHTKEIEREYPSVLKSSLSFKVEDSTFKNEETILISNENNEFLGLNILNINTGEVKSLYRTHYDIEFAFRLKKQNKIIFTLNINGFSHVYYFEKGSSISRISIIPLGIIETMEISNDENYAAFRIKTPTSPSDIYLLNINNPNKLNQITFSMLGGLKASEMVEPKLVTYNSDCLTKIQAWLYIPKGSSNKNKFPFVISIHGGPEKQERPGYSSFYQRLLSLGIGIIAPNIRGSVGYGVSFQRSIYKKWGETDRQDIYATYKYLINNDFVDIDRIAVYGGSYGGFVSLTALTRIPVKWAAGIIVSAPSDLLTFIRRTPQMWQNVIHELIGDPEYDRGMLISNSPINHLANINCPILIIHGEKDPRVPIAEAYQLIERLSSLNKEVVYQFFEDEGHGFSKRKNELIMSKTITNFLVNNLLS